MSQSTKFSLFIIGRDYDVTINKAPHWLQIGCIVVLLQILSGRQKYNLSTMADQFCNMEKDYQNNVNSEGNQSAKNRFTFVDFSIRGFGSLNISDS